MSPLSPTCPGAQEHFAECPWGTSRHPFSEPGAATPELWRRRKPAPNSEAGELPGLDRPSDEAGRYKGGPGGLPLHDPPSTTARGL
ncbi:hypothetical protein NDU88_003815 [Pleurodeles waltl]|uniref:Uncharacterized protein n=1 Tax=Pleurodeles waltl TaxID=8319 RepID=A0AAV7QCS0_PLEWA|nr:hypothetical protein NDU88_003815 [Pleurodeles waltl]